jgi:hypothetical protein
MAFALKPLILVEYDPCDRTWCGDTQEHWQWLLDGIERKHVPCSNTQAACRVYRCDNGSKRPLFTAAKTLNQPPAVKLLAFRRLPGVCVQAWKVVARTQDVVLRSQDIRLS